MRARRLSPRRVGPPVGPALPAATASVGALRGPEPPAQASPPPRSSDGAALSFLRARDADARLCSLGASLAAARPVLGGLATALVGGRLHEALGYRSLGDYGRERLGVGARVIREWARVWRRLEELPQLRAAVQAGEVGWTVARLVAGLATPATEAACLAAIHGRTVRAVLAIVAAFRAAGGRGQASEAEHDQGCERIGVRLHCTRREALLWSAAVELARRTAGEELALWECAERIAAEAASAWGAAVPCEGPDGSDAPLVPEPTDPEHGLRQRAFPGIGWRARTGALPAEIAALARTTTDLPAREIDRRVQAVIAFLQRVDFEMGRILREMQARGLFRSSASRASSATQQSGSTSPRPPLAASSRWRGRSGGHRRSPAPIARGGSTPSRRKCSLAWRTPRALVRGSSGPGRSRCGAWRSMRMRFPETSLRSARRRRWRSSSWRCARGPARSSDCSRTRSRPGSSRARSSRATPTSNATAGAAASPAAPRGETSRATTSCSVPAEGRTSRGTAPRSARTIISAECTVLSAEACAFSGRRRMGSCSSSAGGVTFRGTCSSRRRRWSARLRR